MYGKAIISLAFITLLLITFSLLIGTVDIRSYFFPSPDGAHNFPCKPTGTQSSPSAPLKVYMYDLPRRFNIGMMERKKGGGDDTPVTTAEELPRWPVNAGVRRQHSVEYWLMASLLGSGGEGEEREAVRVLDPENAEAFFVPFFSSLSFNTHGRNMTDPETEKDRQLQVDLISFLRKSKYWQRSGGRDHVIPMTHPNAFRFLRQLVNASILIVADFGRYPKSLSTLSKDVVSPYVHNVDSFKDDDLLDPFESRKTLLFFRGNTVRKDKGKVRAKLEKILAGYDDIRYERSSPTAEAIQASTQGMRSSKFCLHPAGDTPSSCRLFDAIVSHCVPVIVSDLIELPYEDEIDYSQFSIFFSINEAIQPDYLVNQLRQFPKDRWIKMWRQLKKISHHFEFHYPPMKEDAVNMLWRQVKHKLPGVQLEVHRNHRLKVPDWWQQRR
uniref:Exostosin GT47 domain-containing protein n=1 Tax=Salix viminalis TaxID=40686 RepID=A0A6N2LQ84_SALVM